MNRRVAVSPAAAAEECARHILMLLEDALAAGAAATLAVSGGSSPKPMFEYFAHADFDWTKVDLFWVDERAVPPLHQQSNFKLAHDCWLESVRYPESKIHRIPAELPPQFAASRYVEEIQSFFGLRTGELPKFEVIHGGMGPDAHTASLFPGEAKIDDHSNIASAVWAEPMKQWRITLLPGVLQNARHTVMLVAGADKRAALKAVLEGPRDPKKYPAQIVANDGTMWFLDQAAAQAV